MAKHYGIDGVGTLVELGKGGPKINNAAGVVEIKNNANNAYADLTAFKATLDSAQFATAPTVGPFATGHLYYDATWETLSLNAGRDVTLQIGQEDLRRVYNNTGALIENGYAVYVTGVYSGGTNDVVTVALAKSDSATSAFVLGCATQDIPNGEYGFVTVRGHINGLNTNHIGAAYLVTQGMTFEALAGGTGGNAYTFTVIDTTTGGLSYTEVGGAVIVDLGGTTPTRAQLFTLINTTTPSAYIEVHTVDAPGNVVVASVLSFSGGVATAAGDVLYLSEVVSGKLRVGVPDPPNLEIRIGRIITKSATVGRINIRIYQGYRLNDLVDVTTTTPAVDEVLRYNGSQWVNGTPGSVSAGPGIEFFNCTPVIVSRTSPSGLSQNGTAGNGVQINSLSKTPVTTAEQLQAGQAVSDTRAFVAWLYNTALGRTTIDAGVWDFTTFMGVNSTGGGRVTTLTRNIYQVVPVSSGSVTITNLGANTKTATITSGQFTGTYFAANATNTTASYLQTPSGIYQISAVASVNSVTIIVPTGYVNETSVTFNLWNKLFGSTSATITAISPAYAQYDVAVTTPAFTVALTDKLGQMGFITSNNTTTLTVAYNGTARNTHFSTPLVTLHNNMAGLNAVGGNYQHLTDAHHTALTGGGATTLHSHAVPTTITVAIESTDTSSFPLLVTASTGDLGPKTSSGWGLSTAHAYTGTGTATSGLPRMFLGTNVPSNDDSALLICRAVAGTDLFSHAVRDESTFTSLNTGAYASFDSAPTMNGTIAYNHIRSFQGRITYSGAGVLSALQTFTHNATVNSGTVTNVEGLRVYNATGAGTVTYQIGINIEELTKGGTNFAIYTQGATPSYFTGQIRCGVDGLTSVGPLVGSNFWSTAAENSVGVGIGVHSATYPPYYLTAVGYNSGHSLVDSGSTFNTFLGWASGYSTTTGSTNTYVGAGSGYTSITGAGNVCLGVYSGYYETGSNKLFIDNAKRTDEVDGRIKALVYGIFDAAVANQYFTINGTATATQGLILGADLATNTAGYIKMFAAGANAYYNTFTSGENTANATYTWPLAMPPSSGYVLACTDVGVMSWAAAPSAATMTVVADTTDQTCYPLFVNAATGALAVKTHAAFGFDALNGWLGVGTATPQCRLEAQNYAEDADSYGAIIGCRSYTTVDSTRYHMGLLVSMAGTYITASKTDSGQRIGLSVAAASTSSYFEGTLTTFIGVQSNAGIGVGVSAGAVVTNAYGGYFTCANAAATTTVTNAYGLYVHSKAAAVGTITNAWDIYAASATARSYFAGNVGIKVVAPLYSLHVVGDSVIGTNLLAYAGFGEATIAHKDIASVDTGYAFTTNAAGNVAFNAAFTLDFRIGNVQQARVTPDFFGIGTMDGDGTPATGKLVVQGLGTTTQNIFVGRDSNGANVTTLDCAGLLSTSRIALIGRLQNTGGTVGFYHQASTVRQIVLSANSYYDVGYSYLEAALPGWLLNLAAHSSTAANYVSFLYRAPGAAADALTEYFRISDTGVTYIPAGIVLGLDAATNTAGYIKMFAAGANAYYNTFTSGINTANATYTWPLAMPPSSGYVLACTDAGVMSWAAAPTAVSMTVADEHADTLCYPAFFTATTGDLGPKTNALLAFDSHNILFGIGTADLDGTPAAGTLTVEGSTADGTTNIFVGRDSGHVNVFALNSDGEITTGSWHATTLAYDHGGTGLTAYPVKTIILPAASAALGTTTPATRETREIGTTARPVVDVLKFPHASIAFAWWKFILPDSYNGGDLTAKISYTNIATDSTNKFLFTISAACLPDGGPLDATMGTAVELEATVADTAEDVKIAAWGGAITPSGTTPAGGQVILIKLQRDPADTTHDTTSLDAYVLDLAIEYTTNSYSD